MSGYHELFGAALLAALDTAPSPSQRRRPFDPPRDLDFVDSPKPMTKRRARRLRGKASS